MSAAMQVGTCTRCGRPEQLIGPLHGDRGGPLTCVPCGLAIHARVGQDERRHRLVFRAMEAGFGGVQHASDGELSLELLQDLLRLCHPDRHPPERQELATRVTAELLAMKPYCLPRPAANEYPLVSPPTLPTSRDTGNDGSEQVARRDYGESVMDDDPNRYPCSLCRNLTPMDYCDRCRARFEADCAEQRRKDREYQRKWRARRRQRRVGRCAQCGEEFRGKRRDAQYCSDRCRQEAHRERGIRDKIDPP